MKEMILLVNSDDMLKSVMDAIEHTEMDSFIEVKMTHTYKESIDIAKQFELDGGRMIIARGAHARAIRDSDVHLPVSTIPFTGSNIAPQIAKACNDWGSFAVVGNPAVIQMAREMERPIGANIVYYEINEWDDFKELMPLIRSSGIRAVVGGYDAARAARSYGLHDYCLEISEYEIINAIIDARNLLRTVDRENHWNRLFLAAMDTIAEGVLVVDENGAIGNANSRAVKYLGTNGKLPSLPIAEMSRQVEKVMETGKPVFDELYEFNNCRFTISFMPIHEEHNSVVIVIQETEHVHKVERKIRQRLANKGLVAKNSFENIFAKSPKLRETVRVAKQYAMANSTVLICGETGTGKEMFAQSIHNYSSRKDEAFVAINCATIPSNLLESELFGYVDGAFTGAKRGGKPGLFEVAHKGTIFLDEIGETSLEMQARLLRVLEEHEIMRVGDDQVIPVDIRVIAATNRDLRKMVDEGKFRSDLYYRLDILSLHLPPLRECMENIEPLIDSFAERYSKEYNRRRAAYSSEAVGLLKSYSWPGNVRELKNVIERLTVTNVSGVIDGAEVMGALRLDRNVEKPVIVQRQRKPVRTKEEEQAAICEAMELCKGNKTRASELLKISRPTLIRRLKEMGEME